MFLTPQQMQLAEQRAFARGISADVLMEAAGKGMAQIVQQFHPTPGHLIAFCGRGNNAGDVLVAAHLLSLVGWSTEIRLASEPLGKLPAQKLQQWQSAVSPSSPKNGAPLVLLDGLLGIGARGPLRGSIAQAVELIGHLRQKKGAWVLAADIPTGLDPYTGIAGTPCVEADVTATIAFVKNSLVEDSATNWVGRLALIPLPELTSEEGDPAELLTSSLLAPLLPPRKFDSHKGSYGRLGILAGSPGFLGAARLCTAGALRAGAGLVTLFVPEEIAPLLAPVLRPEAMLRTVHKLDDVLTQRWDALCIGPGLGTQRIPEILHTVREARCPVVVDADALNALATSPELLKACQGPRLLTPHPAEFSRIAPHLCGMPRRQAVTSFIQEFPVTLLLKGARTLIGRQNGPLMFNSTGNPGMGTGGMGDVLTGVCGALLAYGLSCPHAAALGTWLCGFAAEHAVFTSGGSPPSLLAGDIPEHLGTAFQALQHGAY